MCVPDNYFGKQGSGVIARVPIQRCLGSNRRPAEKLFVPCHGGEVYLMTCLSCPCYRDRVAGEYVFCAAALMAGPRPGSGGVKMP